MHQYALLDGFERMHDIPTGLSDLRHENVGVNPSIGPLYGGIGSVWSIAVMVLRRQLVSY